MKKQQNYDFVFFISLFLLPFSICWAGGNKDKDAQTQKQQAVSALSVFSNPLTTIYWNGDGGKGIKIAVLEPSSKGLSENEKWMPSMIQSSITGDFQRFSAMTIIDRQNLEKILGEQKQSLSGNYSDADYISIGKLTNAKLILAGSITKTASAYMLELAVTDAESGERKASYPPKAVSPFALENLTAIKESTVELLKQLGVNLTEQGLKELTSEANTAQILAETALAKGIAAQKQGTVVEALSFYIQAANYDSGLVEATNRMNTLTANISSGNIGADTRNDIAWRKEWVKRLQETETFFANTIKEPQPYYIVYSTDIQKGKVDYQKETIELIVQMGFYPDFTWSDHINGVLTAVNNGLQSTNRAQIWELDWPVKAINTPSPFGNQTKNSTSTVIIEILNENGKSIGKQTVKAPYGFKIKYTRVTPLWQWEGNVSFPAVDVNLITDKLTIRIISIDGIVAENAARQKKISIMPETEWNAMLKKNQTVKKNIESARLRQKADEILLLEQFERAKFERANATYSEALRINPNDVDALIGRGNSYYEDGDKSIVDFTAALRINPNDTDVLYSRGLIYKSKENYDLAIADFTAALRINPNDIYGLCLRAWAYTDKEDYDLAITDFSQVIRLTNNTAGYSYRGIVHGEKGNYDLAIADFTQAIRIDPNNAYNYNYRGNVYYTKKDYDRAITDYETALRLEPNNTTYKENLENARQQRRR